MDNRVENSGKKLWKTGWALTMVGNYHVIHANFGSFKPFFAEKKYKLRKFAPKKKSVDNATTTLRIKKKQFTTAVDKPSTASGKGNEQGKGRKVINVSTPYNT